MKPSKDYAATLERPVEDPDWLGPYGFARNLRWGPFGVVKAAPAIAVQQRAGNRRYPKVEIQTLEYKRRGDGLLYFPSVPRVEPVPARVGTRTVYGAVTVEKKSGRTYAVLWRCECGRRGRMDVSPWRRAVTEACSECARVVKKREFNGTPRETASARAEREADAMRRNPLFAVPASQGATPRVVSKNAARVA